MLSKVEGNTDVVKYSFTGDKNFSNSLTEIINYTPAETTTIKVKGQLKTNCNARFDFVSGAYNLKSITSTTNALVNVNETFDNITPSNGFTIKAIWTSGGTASNAKVTFTPIEILEDLGITIPKDIIRGKPRELKQIAEKASITVLGFHTDNERIEDFKGALSTNLDFVQAKGEEHITTYISTNPYTAIGYGVVTYSFKSVSSNDSYIKLNNFEVGQASAGCGYFFFKPGDKIEISNLNSYKFYDYY